MSRMLKVLLFLCVAAASTAAAAPKKNPDVERTIKSELVKKMFTTKILVGSHIPCPPNVNTSGHNGAIKAVDTELSLDGSIRYFARANCFYATTPGVIDLGVIFDSTRFYVTGGLSGEIDPGTSVWVRSVDFREDRVEVNLSTNNNNSAGLSGKIKYMVGADYRTWDTEKLMEVIAHGILIPTYEKLVQLKTEFEALRANLKELESKYNSPGVDTQTKLVSAIALRDVLERLQKNRAEFIAMGKSDPQAGIYSEKLSALTPVINVLSEEAHKERVAQVREQLQAQLPELSEVQNQVRQKPPSSLAELQRRYESLARYSTLLGERQKLLDGLQNENEAPSPEDVKYMNDSRVEIATAQKALDSGHQQLELSDLTSQYGQLTKKRAQLLDVYSRAFGTPKESSTLHDLVAVLGKIVANRDQAAGLGDKMATTQLKQGRTEFDKFKRKLNPNDPLAASGGQGVSAVNTESEAPKKVSISAAVAVGLLLQKSEPIYPPIAKAARISGTVVIQATISKMGSIQDMHVVSGPPLLQGAALDAVKTWSYRPFLLKGKPVEVETTVNVIFTLGG